MTSEVLLVQGSTIKISDGAVTELTPSPEPTFFVLDCIGREITVTGGTSTEIDTTTFCSTAKEFKLGLPDAGTMSLSGHWVPGHEAFDEIAVAHSDKLTRLIEVEFEDGSTFRVLAIVQQRSFSMAVDGVVSATFNFRLTGATSEVTASV